MERDRALEQDEVVVERGVEEMRVELEIDRRLQLAEQRHQSLAPAQLVGGSDVGDRAAAEMLGLEQLADEDVAVVHEGGELGQILPQRLDGARAVDDVGMRRIGEQLLDVIGAEGPVALAQHDELGVVEAHGLGQAAEDAAAVAGRDLVERDGAGAFGALEGAVLRVVADDDDALDQRMREKVLHRAGDAFFVVVGGQRDGDAPAAHRLVADRHVRLLAMKQHQQVEQREREPGTIGTPLYQTSHSATGSSSSRRPNR